MYPTDYSTEIEQSMITFFDSLSEKDCRRYAAVEAQKIGHGGLIYIATLLGCDQKTIQRGLRELTDADNMKQEGIQLPGGGAKSKI